MICLLLTMISRKTQAHTNLRRVDKLGCMQGMQFEFESECGLKVIHTDGGLRCVLSEVDARVHGHAPYYSYLDVKQRDPLAAIHNAGWNDFKYGFYQWDQYGRATEVQLADLFGVCLYLATVPKDKIHLRRNVYHDVCQTLEVPTEGPYELMEQVKWDLHLLYVRLKGGQEFPKDIASCSAITLPDNRSIQYPLQLYNMAYYRKIYDTARKDFLETYAPGPKVLSLVSYPDVADQRTWSCPKEGCAATATQPALMAKHLGGHEEYDGAELRIGTVKFQTRAGTAKVIQTTGPYKIQKAAVSNCKRTRSTGSTSKPRKNSKHDTATDKVLEMIQKQNDTIDQMQKSMTEKDGQMARLLTLHERQDARQEEREARQEKKDNEMLQLMKSMSQKPAIEANTQGAPSLDEAEDWLRRMVSWRQMTAGS